jgi:DNA-packaging protein gp3
MAAGRPTDYSKDILKQTEAYLAKCIDTFDGYVRTKKANGTATEWRNRLVVKLPSVAGLAVNLKLARSTIYEWAKSHTEFSDMLERILAEQEKRVLENGLSGEYNATIAKLVLAKHGYRDEQDITSGGEPITTITASDRKAITELRDLLKQSHA